MSTIDLRSDTVTRPTKGMLEAMFKAEVGDDVFAEDPTVNALEAKSAKLFGMEAGLFCPSGTMTNQVAIRMHTKAGDELLCDATAHIYQYEGGGIASNSQVQAKLLNGVHGKITPAQVEENINPHADWLTRTSLVSVENTGNKSGGGYYTFAEMQTIAEVCKKHGLKYHLDGARIFNALVETKEKSQDLGKIFDSISVCLSKGLGSPSGSVLLGSKEFIKMARKVRKSFGGGMRQAGYIAAAGIYALDNHIERLKEDHARTKKIEDTLKTLPYVEYILPVYTNIIIFKLKDSFPLENFMKTLNENQIKASVFGKQIVRMVTHLDFNDAMLDKVLGVLKKMQPVAVA